MAKIIENDKNFKIIEVSESEVKNKIGGFGICDSCNGFFGKFKYIAVLNSCYCQECYDKWYEEAINYPEDQKYEDMCHTRMLTTLNADEVYKTKETEETNLVEKLFEDFFANIVDEMGEDSRENFRSNYYTMVAHFTMFLRDEIDSIGLLNTEKIFSKVDESINVYVEEIKNNLIK
ncbi:MAG TPA: hypothetical protein VIV55_09955 [Flavobacterium sp.]